MAKLTRAQKTALRQVLTLIEGDCTEQAATELAAFIERSA